MDKRQLLWIIPVCFGLGMLLGWEVSFPTKIQINLTSDDNIDDWFSEDWWTELDNTTSNYFKNMCCFPDECEQAENNPELCTCIYNVRCESVNG